MSFAETFREERLISRRSRARKARIAGRVIGFALSACFVVALRTDPQLRTLVEDLALAVIGTVAPDSGAPAQGDAQSSAIAALGYAAGSQEARVLDQLGIGAQQSGGTQQAGPSAPLTSRLPQSTVKVRRGVSD